jgi:hypothetical protein
MGNRGQRVIGKPLEFVAQFTGKPVHTLAL